MKTTLLSLIVLFTLLLSIDAHAQYPYRRSSGLDRMDNSRYAAPSKKEPVDFVKSSTDKMTKDLDLDGFQSAVVKTIMEDYKNQYGNIMAQEIPNDAKKEKIKIISDKMEARIAELLNPEQAKKFESIKVKNDKDSKKDKKKKKNKDVKEEEEKIESLEE